MSDQLAAAAAALNAPEVLVQRSAEARAKATGGSVDDILAGDGTRGGSRETGEDRSMVYVGFVLLEEMRVSSDNRFLERAKWKR